MLSALLTLSFGGPCRAQSASPHDPTPAIESTSPPPPYWENRGRWILGAQVGLAFENSIPHDISHIVLVIAQPQIAMIARQFQSPHSPVRQVEMMGEGILGNAVHPGGRVTGASFFFRLDGPPHKRLVPFFDVGAGFERTTLYFRAPELSGPTQFSPQGGPGIMYFFNPQRAIVVEYRYYHMSNAGLQDPNHGINANMLTIGLRWLRRPIASGGAVHSYHSHNPFHHLFGGN